MLLNRSIFLQVCFLFTLTQCQDYESEGYGVDESDHSDAQDESAPVDYSKYYSVDTSAPLVSAQGNPSEVDGFTSPIDFAGFFQSLDFGASSKQEVAQPKNPFVAQTQSLGFIAGQSSFPDFSAGSQFPIDYFEQAQRAQQQADQAENEGNDGFIPAGPEYISHNLPLNLDGGYSSGVEKVEPKPTKSKKTQKKFEYDVEKEAGGEFEYQPSVPSGKYADYNTGKSSSTVAQHPQAAGYYEKFTQAPTPTPYQKYSFQPVTEQSAPSKYLGSLISTIAPFNPSKSKIASTAAPVFETQSSENIPSHLKDKNCRRVRKHVPDGEEHGRKKREAMNCFVCEDAENSSKYTQCSYAVEPEPKNDYSGHSERYSTPSQEPEGFRYKRYSGDENSDPYEYIKQRSQEAYTEPKENKEYDYSIPEFYTADEGVDKSFSEIQSEAITKNPANCHKEESEGMTCTICKDPKTGGNFEQCSYTSEPKEQKYAYVTEKKYDSDEPEEGSESKPAVATKQVESSITSIKDSNDDKKVVPLKEFTLPSTETSKYAKLEDFKPDSKELDSHENSKFENFKPSELYKTNYHGHDKFKLSDEYNPDSKEDPTSKKEKYVPSEAYNNGQKSAHAAPSKLINDEPYDIPKHFAETTIKEKKTGVRGLEPSLYGGADSAEAEGDDGDSSSHAEPYSDVDEYHFKLFPEFSNEESQQAEVVADKPSADNTRKDVEEVLAEFSKKDRSACKKAAKNGMTCYLCVDKKGIQHEECMYVSESKPQATHVAYHEVQQIKSPEGTNKPEQVPAGSEKQQVTQTSAATPTADVMQAAASEEFETKVKYNPKKVKKNVKKVREPERAASNEDPERLSAFDDEPKTKAPVEFEVGAEEGAYSAETRPVYSKTLGVKLPVYMIEKSEFEKEFDEFAGIRY